MFSMTCGKLHLLDTDCLSNYLLKFFRKISNIIALAFFDFSRMIAILFKALGVIKELIDPIRFVQCINSKPFVRSKLSTKKPNGFFIIR